MQPLARNFAAAVVAMLAVAGVPVVEGAGAIFSGVIHAECISLMMVIMIILAVIWEAACGFLENSFEDNKAHSELLTKVYKELMILGFIAFAVILSKEFGLHMAPETLHCFEFCDLLVSITVLLYVLNTAISCTSMHVTRRNWDRMSMKPVGQISNDVTAYLERVKGSCWRHFRHKISLSHRWRDESDFKVLQLLFQGKFHLHPKFDFVMYIKEVLEDNIIEVANIGTWHWALIMVINAIWYTMILFIHGNIADFGVIEEQGAEEGAAHRRQLGGAAVAEVCSPHLKLSSGYDVTCESVVNVSAGDLDSLFARMRTDETHGLEAQCGRCVPVEADHELSAQNTLLYGICYAAVGWFTLLVQMLIVKNIGSRMAHILRLHGADEDDEIVGLLEELNTNAVKAEEHNYEERNEDGENKEDDETHVHVDVVGDEDEDDHIMYFKRSNRDSNTIMSKKTFNALIFATKFLQLVIDFYFGFYICHMIHRVAVAWSSEELRDSQVLIFSLLSHGVLVAPVALMVFVALPLTTRNISLLHGVLHLHQDAVSEVLEHMEAIRKLRRRITDRLKQVRGAASVADVDAGRALLAKAEAHELKLLAELSKLDIADDKDDDDDVRLSVAQCKAMLVQHATSTSIDDLMVFCDRTEHKKFRMDSSAQQATAQTARTLRFDAALPPDADTITVEEFAKLLLREIAAAMNEAHECGLQEAELLEWERRVKQMKITTDFGIETARALARTKQLFTLVDKDGSGLITRAELFSALRRYKVPITKTDFVRIVRVIDPDQSGSMSMEEWIDFMMATDDDLDSHVAAKQEKDQVENAAKSTSLLAIASEGVAVFAPSIVAAALPGGAPGDVARSTPGGSAAAAQPAGTERDLFESGNRDKSDTFEADGADTEAAVGDSFDNPLAGKTTPRTNVL